ncbi:hypothetical protein V8E53_015008 [Lactarius tabidus]
MGDQYPSESLPRRDFLVQGEDHATRPTASSEASNLWDQCLPEWWQYYLANIYSQETASIFADATNPPTKWPQSVDRQTARSPILSQGQSPETPPSSFAHSNFGGSIGNQAEAMPECHTHAEYDQELEKQKAHAQVAALLDEFAWLFSRHGEKSNSIPSSLATTDNAILVVNPVQLGQEVQLRLYDAFIHLKQLGSDLQGESIDRRQNERGSRRGGGLSYTKIARSPTAGLKAIKNATEIEGFRACRIRDGAALVRYFAWLEEQGVKQSESQGADQLRKFHSELSLFKGLSLTTISSASPNIGMWIAPSILDLHSELPRSDYPLLTGTKGLRHHLKDQIYLCDSGGLSVLDITISYTYQGIFGQHLDGTTDVTRTLHFGTPTDPQHRTFTRVLQWHIDIDTTIFPNGTFGV